MKAQHTPGPWIAQRDPHALPNAVNADYVIGIEGGPIDYVAVCSERDAEVIAAAPRLFVFAQEVSLGAYTLDEAADLAKRIVASIVRPNTKVQP
ncbi:MAG: hypothetical protein DI635_00600 [Pseudoxanthomonas suwonensis]|nr:MAG: hypothetical protein DI635_00600 [Pseudoxanthomonas suwonensis]